MRTRSAKLRDIYTVVVIVTVLVSNKNGNIRQCGKNNLGIDIFCCTNLTAIAAHLLQTCLLFEWA
jgi:hypothetical protein